MNARLKIDLQNGLLEIEGEEKFVESIYKDFKEQLKSRSLSLPRPIGGQPLPVHVQNLNQFATLADCFGAIGDSKIKMTGPFTVLVAAAYLQEKDKLVKMSGQEINSELKQIGRAVKNITREIQANIDEKPSLMIQLKKSGKSKQARKEYKVTPTGIQHVERLLRGETIEPNEKKQAKK